ncbi:unnamed protein product [Bubo scandiacus]
MPLPRSAATGAAPGGYCGQGVYAAGRPRVASPPVPAKRRSGRGSFRPAPSLVSRPSAATPPATGDYLLGIKRLRRLYCNVGIGFHIQVLPDGRIDGIHSENRYSLLEISPVERGVCEHIWC